jgi:hypothetical protein
MFGDCVQSTLSMRWTPVRVANVVLVFDVDS